MESDWYFAFGANMSTRVFEKRRGMQPIESGPALVTGWKRAFVERGLPLVEPVFAGLMPDASTSCWGVVYRLSARDAQRLDRFEGSGYARVRVEAKSDAHGAVNAFAYTSRSPVHGRKPSRRYLSLLIEGAKEHALPEEVIELLQRHPSTHIPVLSSMVSGLALVVDGIARKR